MAINVPYTTDDAPCTTGTQDMTKFPDNASAAGSANNLTDPNGGTYTASDKDGFQLFQHDITGDSSTTGTVNYVNFNKITYCYDVDGNGTVHQYLTDGTEKTD